MNSKMSQFPTTRVEFISAARPLSQQPVSTPVIEKQEPQNIIPSPGPQIVTSEPEPQIINNKQEEPTAIEEPEEDEEEVSEEPVKSYTQGIGSFLKIADEKSNGSPFIPIFGASLFVFASSLFS